MISLKLHPHLFLQSASISKKMTSSRVLKVTIDLEIGYPRKFERICKGELRSRYIRYPCGPPTAFVAGVATINAVSALASD
jgi:hypothetical protein